jgi:TonB family protein
MLSVLIFASALAVQPTETKAEWVKQPTAENVRGAVPAKAQQAGVGGQVTLVCVVTVTGTLRDCRPQSETPIDMGFGNAAVVLSSQFLMKPAMRDGAPVESKVAIPITFPALPALDAKKLGVRRMRILPNVPWASAPSYDDVLAAWPEKAKVGGQGGNVVLNCEVLRDGDLSECTTEQEQPFGQGFGGAAAKLVRKFRAQPLPESGQVFDHTRTRVVFSFAPDALKSPSIGKPRWVALPKHEDMAERLPPQARAAGVFKARVVMSCTVQADGSLGACQVDSETPANLGYGAAAVDLGRIMKVNIWTVEGLPTIGGKITVPLTFDLSGLTPPPAP